MATGCGSLSGAPPSAPGKLLVSPMRLCFHGISSSSATPSSGGSRKVPGFLARASLVDSSESSYGFAKRMELAWLISKQPKPIACSTCESNGYVECKWCAGTGFFILSNQMLCQVPSRNTACVICTGKGSAACRDCKGTGFRAKWLEDPPPPK
ncbi:uncharacterized protein LOC141834359 [Curcuma longa]|uniref:uncharacterized protein LOC141834359 n=1 Tax=Curcuma longa TaxID=136217 RepID=UPI003D9F5239